jgi:uncharacterized SAM-binding protein YcdF (DUF218 family)
MIVNELLDRPHAQVLWDYNQLKQPLNKSDFIFVMCSYNLDIADYAHILFQQKMGKKIVLSGGLTQSDNFLIADWDDPESVVFKNHMVSRGMNKNEIIVEDAAQTTLENVELTKTLLADALPEVVSGLVVHKPYMERRAYTTACKNWPEIEWRVTSPMTSYDKYVAKFDEEGLINRLVRETWEMKDETNPAFQIMPEKLAEVQKSMEALINRGYKKYIKV